MEVVFLKAIKCRLCGQLFFICQSCWRGHAYCSDIYRHTACLNAKRKRQHKYRRTKKGRENHRQTERRRRMRHSKKTVGDASSNFTSLVISSTQNLSFSTPCCHFCGAKGVLADQFPRRRYGGRRSIVSANHIFQPGVHYDQKKPNRKPPNP